MDNEYLTVSQLNSYIARKMKFDPKLKNIYVKGEISNYKTYSSGHSYFTLKDEKSQIPAVLFKGRKRFLKFMPEDGMKVIVKGKIDVYERDGKYQLQAATITEDGVGALHIAFEQLKKKLAADGLFDEAHKKEIPKYPKRIGVVTSSTGAAVRDIIRTIKGRYPYCEILVFSTLVQGDLAAPQIVRKIVSAQRYDIDTLIVGRGGGSLEDLWPFNEEIVAKAIYECEIPTISAVGHEVDWTIADFVADARAPTPTGAATIAVPDSDEVRYRLGQITERLNKSINDRINANRTRLENVSQKQIMKNPESIYEMNAMHLDSLVARLEFASKSTIAENRNRLFVLENKNVLKNPKSMYKIKKTELENIVSRLEFASKSTIAENRNRLYRLESRNILKNPEPVFRDRKRNLDSLVSRLEFASKNTLAENRNRLYRLENSNVLRNPEEITKNKKDVFLRQLAKLEILNPLITLKRGYTLTKKEGKAISSADEVNTGDELEIEFNDGTVNTKVI